MFCQIVHPFRMFFGDDQNMGRGLGIDVLEGHRVFIFDENLRGYLFVYDFAKDTVLHKKAP